MKSTYSVLQGFHKDWKMLLLAGSLSFAFVLFVTWLERPNENAIGASVDTLIPAGFLLIPIEVQNYESLDSLLGKYGVVDLYKGTGKNGRIVARNIRILRAPQNPSHFAVLAPEMEAGAILREPGNFYVALKGPTQHGTQIVIQHGNSRRIQFDGE